MKVVIPIAGEGSRMRPHTHSTQKGLMRVAGKQIIDYVIDDVKSIDPSEVVFVVGHRGDDVQKHVAENHPDLNSVFVEQKHRDGDGGAVRLALEQSNKDEEMYIVFGADTLIDFNLKKAIEANRGADSVIMGMRVDNPSSYGVVNVDDNMNIYAVEEKPEEPKSDIAIIGSYYFKSSGLVKQMLDHFYKEGITAKGEYRIAQVVEQYAQNPGLLMKAHIVDKWFDCGRPEVMLAANEYFLSKKSNGNHPYLIGNSTIFPPVEIGEGVSLDRCTIGPNVSIGPGAQLTNVNVENSILGQEINLENRVLGSSIIGPKSTLVGRKNKINLGANSQVDFS